jgi:hypothetical protein
MPEMAKTETAAYALTVADLLRKQAGTRAHAVALQDARGVLSYVELDRAASRLAQALLVRGLRAGDRVAVLSENCREYLQLQLAAAKIGVVVACLNWRLADAEITHCLRLVSPCMVFVSLRHAPTLARVEHGVPQVILIETQFDTFLSGVLEDDPLIDVDPEQGLVILYTSGTTGLPKGAVISQRAMVARAMCFAGEYGITAEHGYVAWSPLFHMAATDFSLATLMLGGKVVVQDGLDVDRLCATIAAERHRLAGGHAGHDRPLIDGLKPQRHPAARRAHGRGHGRPGAAAADRRSHRPAERALPQQLRRHRDRPGAGVGGAAGTRGGAHQPGQARVGVLQPAPGRCRRPRRAGGHAGRSWRCAGRRCSRATGTRPRPTRTTSAAAGSTWATCSCAAPTARWTSSTAPST